MYLTVKELLHYTDEERERWDRWFQANGEELLTMPIAGERHMTVGRLILYTFGAELRFVERLRRDRLTEYSELPSSTVEAVFGFGLKARQALREYVAALGADDWKRCVEIDVAEAGRIRVSVRKVIVHSLVHEIRHWAQVARVMRDRGFLPPDGYDLLVSDALD